MLYQENNHEETEDSVSNNCSMTFPPVKDGFLHPRYCYFDCCTLRKAVQKTLWHLWSQVSWRLSQSGVSNRQNKTKWFQQCIKVDHKIISALIKLTKEGDVTQAVKDTLARFVCSLYFPKGIHMTNMPDLRWPLFYKYLAESSNFCS